MASSRILSKITPKPSKTPNHQKPFLVGTATGTTVVVKQPPSKSQTMGTTTPAKRVAQKKATTVTAKRQKSIVKKQKDAQTGKKKFANKPRAPSPPPQTTPIEIFPPTAIVNNTNNTNSIQNREQQDNTLDFTRLCSVQNVNGKMKMMTSTPNSSYSGTTQQRTKKGRNSIMKRRPKRQVVQAINILTTNDGDIDDNSLDEHDEQENQETLIN